MQLNERQKKLLIEGKHYLENNDLLEFYEEVIASLASKLDDISDLTKFFIENGVSFTKNLKHIVPAYMCKDESIPPEWLADGGKTLKLPGSIGKISYASFAYNDQLENLYIPSVVYIDEYAFSHCDSIKKIYFGSKIDYLDDYAFSDRIDPNKLEVYVPKNIDIGSLQTILRNEVFSYLLQNRDGTFIKEY